MKIKKGMDYTIWTELRQGSCLTSKATCDHVGISRQYLFNIEKGRSVPAEANKEKILQLYVLHLETQKKLHEEKLSRINSLLESVER